MLNSRQDMDPMRLCDAAQATLIAAAELGQRPGRTGRAWPHPVELMGTPLQPKCLAPYARWEVEQACEFLVRLGMLEPKTGSAAQSKPGRKN